jgi:hypothetical protein
MTVADNARRWDGRAGAYEVWYLTTSHAASGTGYWIRYTLEAPLVGEPHAALWFARFAHDRRAPTFGIHAAHPTSGSDAFGHDYTLGKLAGDGHEVSWDLRWTPSPTTLRMLPDLAYLRDGLGETTVLSPNPDVTLGGKVTVDGETLDLTGTRGGQTHIWGQKHAFAWAWGHANLDGGATLEALTVRLKRRGVVTPPLTFLSLRCDDDEVDLRQLRHVPLARSEMSTGRYYFRGENLRTRLEGEFRADHAHLIQAEYEDPDGEPSYCANSCVADLTLTRSERTRRGWRVVETFRADKTAQFETASRTHYTLVTASHVRVS